MKLMVKSTHIKPRLWRFGILLSLISSLLIPATAFSDSTDNRQLDKAPTELSISSTTAKTQLIDGASTSTHTKKTTLNEDSRGLSTFLLIGIIINIIMAIVFAWWFSTQWRQSKK